MKPNKVLIQIGKNTGNRPAGRVAHSCNPATGRPGVVDGLSSG